MTDPILIPCAEAARLVSLSERAWRRLVAAEQAPAPVRLGSAVRWRRSEVIAWEAANRSPAADQADGCVYLMGREGDRTVLKIGYALDPCARLAALQTGSPEPLELVAVLRPMQQRHEAQLHAAFSSARVRGEWFDAASDGPVGAIARAWHIHPDLTGWAVRAILDREQFASALECVCGAPSRAALLGRVAELILHNSNAARALLGEAPQ